MTNTNPLTDDFMGAARCLYEVYFPYSDYDLLDRLCHKYRPARVLVAMVLIAESVREELLAERSAKSEAESVLFREFRIKGEKACEFLLTTDMDTSDPYLLVKFLAYDVGGKAGAAMGLLALHRFIETRSVPGLPN